MFYRWGDLERTFAALDTFRRRMDRMLDHYGRGDEGTVPDVGWPLLSLYDEGSRLTLYAEVPGLGEEDIELTLNQDVLSIKGQRKTAVPEGYAVHRRERGDFHFSRALTLPCRVDPEKVDATVKSGILTVHLDKAPEAKPRQISVKAS